MAPTPANAASRARPPSQVGTAPTPATRATRSRAAGKDTAATPVGAGKPSGILARVKEGLRKVSDKIVESKKDKVESKKRGVAMISEGESSESLKVSWRIGFGF